MRACASGPPPRGDGRPPLPAHPEGLAATLRVLQSTLYSGRNSAVMAGPMAELDLQREVEALRARRRLSVNRLALVDPDLPGLDAAVPVPGTPPSPSAEAGGVPPSNPSSVPIFGSSRRDRSQTRRQIPVPALPDSNIWVPASAHPEVSPGDFRAFMREQAERNVQHAEAAPEVLLTRSPSLTRRTSLLRKQAENDMQRVEAAPDVLLTRSPSLTRRASLLRQQVHPDEAPPARRGSLLAMDEPAAPEKPAADREHAANGEAGHALHRSPAQRSSRAPRRRPVTEELGEVQDVLAAYSANPEGFFDSPEGDASTAGDAGSAVPPTPTPPPSRPVPAPPLATDPARTRLAAPDPEPSARLAKSAAQVRATLPTKGELPRLPPHEAPRIERVPVPSAPRAAHPDAPPHARRDRERPRPPRPLPEPRAHPGDARLNVPALSDERLAQQVDAMIERRRSRDRPPPSRFAGLDRSQSERIPGPERLEHAALDRSQSERHAPERSDTLHAATLRAAASLPTRLPAPPSVADVPSPSPTPPPRHPISAPVSVRARRSNSLPVREPAADEAAQPLHPKPALEAPARPALPPRRSSEAGDLPPAHEASPARPLYGRSAFALTERGATPAPSERTSGESADAHRTSLERARMETLRLSEAPAPVHERGPDRGEAGSSERPSARDKKTFGLSWFGLARDDDDRKRDETASPKRRDRDLLSTLFGKRKHHDATDLRNRAKMLFTNSSTPPAAVVMRYPVHVERALYRLSHFKLANPRRPLQEQVVISNLMFWYLSTVNAPPGRPTNLAGKVARGPSEYDDTQRRTLPGTGPVAVHTGSLVRAPPRFVPPPMLDMYMHYAKMQPGQWMPGPVPVPPALLPAGMSLPLDDAAGGYGNAPRTSMALLDGGAAPSTHARVPLPPTPSASPVPPRPLRSSRSSPALARGPRVPPPPVPPLPSAAADFRS